MAMYELPLFPLNTVLFPGMPLQLHIFEDRYKMMVRRCLNYKEPFGVVLIRKGEEALGPLAEPYSVGCSANIVQSEQLSEGRLNLLAVGVERFRTLSLDTHQEPYLVGIVEPLIFSDEDTSEGKKGVKQLQPWLLRYLKILSQKDDFQVDLDELPEEPVAVAYLAAVALQVSQAEKQDFLGREQVVGLLNELKQAYRRELGILEKLINEPNVGSIGNFSVN